MKDTEISFNITNNTITGTVTNCAVNLGFTGNVTLDKAEIPEGMEVVIRKVKPKT